MAAALLTATLLVACSEVQVHETTAAPRGTTSNSGSNASPADPQTARTALITHVVDGDTIDVEVGQREIRIRLIGIDTPETVDPSEPVQCFGPEASAFTEQQLDGEQVRLEFDVERIDPYNRTLAYVWRGNQLFNEVLVSRGFALVTTYPPNVKYVDRFIAAQRDARSHERGLWGAVCNEQPVSTGGGNCDRQSYPTVCIPPYPPDLDCGDVPFTYFEVKPPDPHGFDGNNDGVGCET